MWIIYFYENQTLLYLNKIRITDLSPWFQIKIINILQKMKLRRNLTYDVNFLVWWYEKKIDGSGLSKMLTTSLIGRLFCFNIWPYIKITRYLLPLVYTNTSKSHNRFLSRCAPLLFVAFLASYNYVYMFILLITCQLELETKWTLRKRKESRFGN